MLDRDWEVLVDDVALLGEGPHWDGERLWWVDIEGELIHRTIVDTGHDEAVEVGAPVGSVVPRAGGGFVCGFPDGVALFDGSGAAPHRIVIEVDDPESRMNDAKCDPAGRLFTGTMTSDQRRSTLYRVDADHSVTTVFTGVGISNGLGWSPDGTRMYYIDTPTMRVDVIDYDPATGTVEHRRPLIEVAPGQGFPDGMCVDAEGCLWVAFWDGWSIRRFDPDGSLMRTVDLPAQRITSCAFGGADLDRLFVTSASCELDDAQRSAQPHAGALFEIDPGCRGITGVAFAG
ncbi:MAG: SMP-30/gluconolactonase/LRE family protein [Acidimicrobiia bacterium]|nr:SMP-30/gluconolactonase/LRE family protein [Acidimicrobiia bacterium]